MGDEYWKSSPFGENSIFHPSWDKKQEEERIKREHENLQYIPNANIKAGGVFYLSDGTWLGKVGHTSTPVYVVCETLLKAKKNFDVIKQNLIQIHQAITNPKVKLDDKIKGVKDLLWYIKHSISLQIEYGVLTSNAMLTVISYAESHRDERGSYEQNNPKKKDGTYHNFNDKAVGSPFGANQLTKSTFRLYRKHEGKQSDKDLITSPSNQEAVARYMLKTISKGKVYTLLFSSELSEQATQAITLQKIYDFLGENIAPIDKKTEKPIGDHSTWPSLPGQSQNKGKYALKADKAQKIFNNEITKQIINLYNIYSTK